MTTDKTTYNDREPEERKEDYNKNFVRFMPLLIVLILALIAVTGIFPNGIGQ